MATPAEAMPHVALPPNIGRFKPLRVLGRGGQGVVYLAHDPKLGREVALKTLTKGKHDPNKLLSEARNVARLDHPGIVPLYEIELSGNTPYLAYQFAEGQTLGRYLERRERWPLHQVLKICTQLLDAIGYAHGQQILHRDLSPANILLDSELRPRILDFGVSTVIVTGATGGQIVGTLNFVPPEVVSNGPVGPHSDLYSLGVILYEILTGQRLFVADTSHATLYKIMHDKVLPPSAFNPEISPALDGIVVKALARDPASRYACAADMRRAIDELNAAATPAEATRGKISSEVELLLRRMSRKPDFPAVSQLIVEINQKSGRPESDDINDLANAILKDFALTTKLLKLVNSAVYGQYGGTITTVSRAVSILGFDAIRMAALSIAVFENLKSGSQADALKDAACSSFLSAVLGKELARGEKGLDSEETFIGAMFHRLGRHLAIYYFPEEFTEIKSAIEQRGISEAEAVREILGTGYADLGLAVAKQWNFPESMRMAMTPPPDGKVAKARSAASQSANIAAYANEISECIALAKDERDLEARLDRLTERFSDTIAMASKQIRELVTRSIEATRAYAKVLTVDVQSSNFFKRVVGRLSGAASERATTNTNAAQARESTAAEATTADERRMVLVSAMTEVTNALIEQAPITQIFAMVVEAFYRGVNFSNVFLMLRDPKRHCVQARLGFGENTDEIIPKFSFKIDDSTDVFNESLRKAREFVVLDTQAQQYAARVPGWCRSLTNPHSLLLFPLAANNVCIGLIYADKVNEQVSVSVQELKLLNTLIKQASLAVAQRR